MIKITPISVSFPNWQSFLDEAFHYLKRTISQTVDINKGLQKTIPGFIVTLHEFQSGGRGDSCKMLREAGSLLRHVFFSFLCVTPKDTLDQIREETKLSITSVTTTAGYRVSIISGDLELWRNSILICSSDRVTTDVRAFFNQIMAYFETIGLSEIFADYSRTPMNDSTFRLTEK